MYVPHSISHLLPTIQPESTPWWRDRIFLSALIVAVALHGALLAVKFVTGSRVPVATQDVSVAVHLSPTKVQQADFLAERDQQGGGDVQHKQARTTPLATQAVDSSMGEQDLQTLQQLQQKAQLDFQERMLMTTLSWQKQTQDQARKKAQQQLESQRQTRAAMIASIEAQFSQRQQIYSKRQRSRTVTDIQTKQDASAAYLERFRQKVEMFGNRDYPEAAKQQALSGDVRLMVIINAQGGIRAIRLLESSGHSILDEAAKTSVRRAAPFGRFDKKMNNINELRIIRTWRFDAKDSIFDVQ